MGYVVEKPSTWVASHIHHCFSVLPSQTPRPPSRTPPPYNRFALFTAPTCPASPSLKRELGRPVQYHQHPGATLPFPPPLQRGCPELCSVGVGVGPVSSSQTETLELRFSSLWDALYHSPGNSGNSHTRSARLECGQGAELGDSGLLVREEFTESFAGAVKTGFSRRKLCWASSFSCMGRSLLWSPYAVCVSHTHSLSVQIPDPPGTDFLLRTRGEGKGLPRPFEL